MNTLFTVGRMLLATAIVSLGLEHLVSGNFPVALVPSATAFTGRFVLVIAIGLALIVAGLGMGLQRKADGAALGLGMLFLLVALLLHVPFLLTHLSNGSTWTVVGELMALGGGTFYAAGMLAHPSSTAQKSWFNLVTGGRLLFAVSLLIFGVLHFVYAPYIKTLIPAWIPAPLFWAYFVGVAFVGTAISLLTDRKRTLSFGLLGLMFLLWVVLLHGPRVINNPRIEPEWTSLWIALAMSGIGFLIAGSERLKKAAIGTDSLPTYASKRE